MKLIHTASDTEVTSENQILEKGQILAQWQGMGLRCTHYISGSRSSGSRIRKNSAHLLPARTD